MRLNLGCGNMPMHGFKNIDLFYYPGTAEMHPEHGVPEDYDWEQGDFTDLSRFEDSTFNFVLMCHSLEHTYWNGAIKALSEAYRVLRQGGKIEIEVPDLDKIWDGDFTREEKADLIYGGRDDNTILLGHHCGFNRKILSELMKEAGFGGIKELPVGYGTSKPEPDRNFRLEGVK